jgi:glycosyltransferase involved in cell wall biosynthesis
MAPVDVIVPCYNYGDLLETCVASVLSQQEVDARVLIMDDASTDSTPEVGRRLAARDPRVKYRRHDVNRGHIATYNEALDDVTADYCMILSADDLLTPGSLMRATRLMDAHPEVGLTYGRDITFRHAPPTQPATGGKYRGHRILTYLEFLDISCRLGHTPIQAPTAIARTALHREIGGYRPELPHSGDTEIWLRMAVHAAVAELDVEQAFRRLHAANMSLGYSPLRRLEEQKRAYDTHFREYAPPWPQVADLERVANRTIAEAAFWRGTTAFENGDQRTCDAFLAFAVGICPDIESWGAWRRFRWKRHVGASAWRWVEPVITRVRKLTHRPGPIAPHRPDAARE